MSRKTCQLTDSFSLVPVGSSFVRYNSNNTRRFFYNVHAAHASTNKTKIVWIETELFLFYPGRTHLVFTCVLGRYVASTALLVPEPFGGRWPHRRTAARRWRVSPFSGVTSSGRVWRKVPESDAGSVGNWLIYRLIQMVNWRNDVVDWNARLIGLYCQLIWVVACLIYWLVWAVDCLTWMIGIRECDIYEDC